MNAHAQSPNQAAAFETASQMLHRLAKGEVTSAELVEQHIARIEAVNPALNAIVVKRYDAARKEAADIDRRRKSGETMPPLAGLPVTIKESFDFQGLPSTYGVQSRANAIAASDDPYVAALRKAGAVALGKTNVPQLLIFIESDNPVYGRTNNPWNAERTCGGSSGGEAAIIAAGGSPLGLGNDIGGSCRYPANFCGIVGIKPTKGRNPDAGMDGVSRGEQTIVSQVGILARTVEDVALGLRVIDRAIKAPLVPAPPLADFRAIDPHALKVGFYTDDGVMLSSPAIRRAVREASQHLAGAGAEVVEWTPPSPEKALHLLFALLSADGGKDFRHLLRGGAVHSSIKPLLFLAGRSRATLSLMRAVLKLAGQPTLAEATKSFGHTDAASYWALTDELIAYRRAFGEAMDKAGIDLILGPTCAIPAFAHGATKDLALAGANAAMHNVTGYPAGSVPVTRIRKGEEGPRPDSRDLVEKAARKCELGSAGLPVGVQVAGRPWREDQVFAAMNVIEQAAPQSADFPHRPPV